MLLGLNWLRCAKDARTDHIKLFLLNVRSLWAHTSFLFTFFSSFTFSLTPIGVDENAEPNVQHERFIQSALPNVD